MSLTTIVCKTVEPLLKFELFAKTRASHSFFIANLLKLVPQAPQTEQKKFFWTAPIAMKTKTRGEVIMIRFQAFQAERVLCRLLILCLYLARLLFMSPSTL